MAAQQISQPLLFEPLFMERIWGGRRLETLYGKRLPPGLRIGEAWEIVDRPEAQSVVREGPWRGLSLHQLWNEDRLRVFGEVAEADRFPLLIKLLDAQERLSLQVHPPPAVAEELGGEAKTEFWYIAAADRTAEIFVGLKKNTSCYMIEQALASGDVEQYVHRLPVCTGDAMFLPSGRIHAIGAGNVIVEIQENSDTTYRIFDWNRPEAGGAPRRLHLEEAFRSIDFNDHEPELSPKDGESLVRHSCFEVEKWNLAAERDAGLPGAFAIFVCLSGEIASAGLSLKPGEFFLVPACLEDRALKPRAQNTTLLRVTVPLP